MFPDEIWTTWTTALTVVLSAFLIVVAVTVIIRIVGLRSLSKMSSFDFTVTVAIGSVMATVVVTSTPLVSGIIGIAALLGVQAGIALLRQRRSRFETLVDNTPLLLMRDGEFVQAALDQSRVTRSDVYAKLREANALQLKDVHAVVLEGTGDVSVLHGAGRLDAVLLDDVRTLTPPI